MPFDASACPARPYDGMLTCINDSLFLAGPTSGNAETVAAWFERWRQTEWAGHAEYAKRTLLADIPAIILQESATLWIVGVERSRTRFLVDWLSELTLSAGENP